MSESLKPPAPLAEGRCAIAVVALNARYGHCAHAARSLVANLKEMAPRAEIIEADTHVKPFQLAATLVALRPQLIGFSVYLWNVALVRETAQILRRVAPEVKIVLGGPEITSGDRGHWSGIADALVVGEGESAFRKLCAEALFGHWKAEGEFPRVLRGQPESLEMLKLPTEYYSADDLAQRTVYVESSRGCPYGCTYCCSCRTPLRLFATERLAESFDLLIARGVREFRFLDRSFNADETHACAVLELLLARRPEHYRIHLEIMPRRFGPRLRELFCAFSPGTLHLEVGVQTLNPEVARAVGRNGDTQTVLEALSFLIREAKALVHADLIFGLPGESESSFAAGFDRIVRELDPPELQVNLLKRLPGTPLAAPGAAPELVFSPNPPYELLRSDTLDFADLARMQGFARCWELLHNRGRFGDKVRSLCAREGGSPYGRIMQLSQRIRAGEGRLYALSASCLQAPLDASLLEPDEASPRPS
ncbi:MAG: B12-binding domain-containing radical SAM protein [Planctomycetes bacterium]|nr:B12-binding domain-containing radical SAM protein [Planctomycetota bacterium]